MGGNLSPEALSEILDSPDAPSDAARLVFAITVPVLYGLCEGLQGGGLCDTRLSLSIGWVARTLETFAEQSPPFRDLWILVEGNVTHRRWTLLRSQVQLVDEPGSPFNSMTLTPLGSDAAAALALEPAARVTALWVAIPAMPAPAVTYPVQVLCSLPPTGLDLFLSLCDSGLDPESAHSAASALT